VVVLQLFKSQQHATQIGFKYSFLNSRFHSGLRDIAGALFGAVEVERVHEEGFAMRHQQIDFKQIDGEIFL